MFVIELTYKKPLEKVDKFLDEHRKFLDKYYERGNLIASGAKSPRDGGIIIAIGDRADVEKILEADPFYTNGVAHYKIIEFNPVKCCEQLKSLLNK